MDIQNVTAAQIRRWAGAAALSAIAGIAMVAAVASASDSANAEPKHGIAMHGEPALPADFAHLPYVNPDAPKGGRMTYANVGTFNSLNPFIVSGTAPRGLWDASWGNNVWESLLVRNRDEPFSLYGLIAETIEVPEDRSWAEFTLRPEARFSDGEPIKVEDVIFSIELLGTKGRPNTYRAWYAKVGSMEQTGERSVRFTFTGEPDREIPLLIGLMPIFPKHATDAETFDQSGLTVPIGSGPYLIDTVDASRGVLLKRNPGYWGRDLPIKRGIDNFDEIRIDYYRDSNAYFEAFKKGLFDYLPETDSGRWSTGYTFAGAQDGRVVLETFVTGVPKGMNGFVLNTRRPYFADPRVREAMSYFFDFEWLNASLYHGLYRRTSSYFQGSELSAAGVPVSEAERALLAPYPDAVRQDVMDGTYALPVTDGSGQDRAVIRQGVQLLAEAGYEIRGGKMVNAETGAPLAFEFLVQTAEQERLALAYQRVLAVVGIDMSVRLVDATQYWDRQKSFEIDMMQFTYPASLSPGNEQLNRWSSEAADSESSFNYAGVKSPAVDAMMQAMLAADSREDFVTAVRALDRVLMSGSYVVPLFHAPEEWVARWARVKRPETSSLAGPEPTTWWIEE